MLVSLDDELQDRRQFCKSRKTKVQQQEGNYALRTRLSRSSWYGTTDGSLSIFDEEVTHLSLGSY